MHRPEHPSASPARRSVGDGKASADLISGAATGLPPIVQLARLLGRQAAREATKPTLQIKDVPHTPPGAAGAPLPAFLTVAEAATILRCSEKTVRRRIAARTLPAIKLGHRWLFAAADIQRALIAGMVRTKSPAANDPSAFAPRAQADTDHQ